MRSKDPCPTRYCRSISKHYAPQLPFFVFENVRPLNGGPVSARASTRHANNRETGACACNSWGMFSTHRSSSSGLFPFQSPQPFLTVIADRYISITLRVEPCCHCHSMGRVASSMRPDYRPLFPLRQTTAYATGGMAHI